MYSRVGSISVCLLTNGGRHNILTRRLMEVNRDWSKRNKYTNNKSKFIDWKRLKVTAGSGGSGCISFRKEAHVEFGGPSGGNGGDGGSVRFIASSRVKTLRDMRHHYRGERGGDGRSWDCHGKNGANKIIKVPVGTVISSNGEVLYDLLSDGDSYIAARGGVGGAGNTSYATPTNTAPLQYTKGTDGDELIIELELKTIADIGLVGFPNAGKSTLLRVLSRAKPKVADYAFTTLNPHVGIMDWNHYDEQIAIADIPGLLPGAHHNYGLGHAFLRHIERCSILVLVLNVREKDPGETDYQLQLQNNNEEEERNEGTCTNVERSDLDTATTTGPVNIRHSSSSLYGKGKLNANEVLPLRAQYQILQDELELYKEGLVDKVKLVVINKVDLEGGEERVLEFINDSPGLDLPLVPVSGIKEWNILELKEALYTLYNNNNNNS